MRGKSQTKPFRSYFGHFAGPGTDRDAQLSKHHGVPVLLHSSITSKQKVNNVSASSTRRERWYAVESCFDTQWWHKCDRNAIDVGHESQRCHRVQSGGAGPSQSSVSASAAARAEAAAAAAGRSTRRHRRQASGQRRNWAEPHPKRQSCGHTDRFLNRRP